MNYQLNFVPALIVIVGLIGLSCQSVEPVAVEQLPPTADLNFEKVGEQSQTTGVGGPPSKHSANAPDPDKSVPKKIASPLEKVTPPSIKTIQAPSIGGVIWVLDCLNQPESTEANAVSKQFSTMLVDSLMKIEFRESSISPNADENLKRSEIAVFSGRRGMQDLVYNKCCDLGIGDDRIRLMVYIGSINCDEQKTHVLPFDKTSQQNNRCNGYSADDNWALADFGFDTANWIIIVNLGKSRMDLDSFLIGGLLNGDESALGSTNCVFELFNSIVSDEIFLGAVGEIFSELRLQTNDSNNDGFIDLAEFMEILARYNSRVSSRIALGNHPTESLLIKCR